MKKILIFLGVIVILFTGIYFYLYKDHRDISEEDAIVVNGLSVVKEFEQNEEVSNKKYLDKTIQISGNLTSYDSKTKSAVLDKKIFVTFVKGENIKSGEKISVKGRLIGFDSLLGEIKVDQCTIIN